MKDELAYLLGDPLELARHGSGGLLKMPKWKTDKPCSSEMESQQLLSKGCVMQEFRCEYEENGARIVLRGPLRDIQRTVGSRPVLLDGVLGYFTMANDGHASVRFVQARASRVRGGAGEGPRRRWSDDDDDDCIAENDDENDDRSAQCAVQRRRGDR